MNRILLVEDNELNRDMLSRRLQRRGFEVLIAIHGVEAVEVAVAEQPDLILMDMSLPLMDGWEATRRIKADPRTQHIPILALTAHVMDGDRQKSLAAGCDDFDTKPVVLDRLLQKMQALASGMCHLETTHSTSSSLGATHAPVRTADSTKIHHGD